MKSSKLLIETIKPLTNREAEPDISVQTFDSQGLNENSQPSMLSDSHFKPLNIIHVLIAHASVAHSKSKVKINSHADTCVVGNNCLIIHDHNRQVNVYSYNPKDGYRSAKKFDATVDYKMV